MPGFRLHALLVVVAAAGCAASGPGPAAVAQEAPAAAQWRFMLDGEPLDPRVLWLEGTGDLPAPGDILPVGEWLVPLEEPRTLRFETDLHGATALGLREEDGSLRRIGLVLDESGLGLAALSAMSSAEARGLRCLRIEAWSEDAARQVARLDPDRVAVVFAPVGLDSPLPPLSPGLRWLAVEEGKSDRISSLEALTGLRSLRFLRVRRYAKGEDFDACLLKGMESLSRLDLGRLEIGNADLLGSLASLRFLDLSGCGVPWLSGERQALSVQFARRLGRLRYLGLRDSSVQDLSPLGGHPSLEEVQADGLRVTALPSVPMPALRRLRFLGSGAAAADLAAFRAAIPDAVVATSWKGALEEAVAGADRVLIRSGGTCHRNPSGEKVLFESGDPDRVRWVLDAIDVADSDSGGRCMCCGHPTIEFRRGPILLAELGMHHGVSLRWPDGWPGDGALTPGSCDALDAWMAESGAPEPLAEWEKERAGVRCARIRWALLVERMPPTVAALLEKGTDRAGFATSLREALPDPVPLAVACLRLYGTGEGTWIKGFGLDYVLEEDLLPEIPREALLEALCAASADPAATDGAARWLFAKDRLGGLDPATAKRVLPALAERALAHPRAYNRRRTLEVLGGSRTEEATVLLRRFLRGEFPVRSLSEDLIEEPFRGFLPPRTGEVYAEFSDRAFAAVLLARRGDRECLPETHALRASATEEDRAVLDEAMGLLDR